MTWTYDVTQLATSALYQARYLVGDTIAADPQAQDEEIAFALTQRPSIYGAAATVCRSLAANFSRLVDTVDRDLRTTYSIKARNYLRMAVQFEEQASARAGALPYAGGISVSDKLRQEQDSDRVQPQYNIGMEDNFLPVGPAGNETQDQACDTGAAQD